MPIHLFARANTDPADGCAVDLNAKFHFRLFAYGSVQEFLRLLDRVGMREKLAYRQPDFAIIRMPCQRLGIVQSPRTECCIVLARAASIIAI
jgi:hypothetical protein